MSADSSILAGTMQSLEAYRQRKKLTQDQLASELSISRVHLARLIAGDRRPSLDLLQVLHEVTGVPVGTLLREALDVRA